MSENNIGEKRKKKKTKIPLWGKILLGLFLVVILAISVGAGLFYSTLNKLDTVEIEEENLGITPIEELEVYEAPEKIKNIALFGVDSENGVGRSDSIMIATIDPIHNKLKITSIMRDSYVNIEGRGYDKINHAYAFGGPELAIKTINQNFGLNIDDFVAVDFNSLPKIINILGGITLNITNEELQYINSYIDDINRKDGTSSPHISNTGEQYVDGVQALAYSRIRYTSGGDYKRTERQRTVLNKLFESASNIAPSQYLSVINQVLPFVRTSMTSTNILELGTKIATMGKSSLEQERFPRDGYCSGQNINGVYYLVFDEVATKQQMQDYIFDDK